MSTCTMVSAWTDLRREFFPIFTQPTFQTFLRLVTGWILCSSRRTITGMIPFADPGRIRSHDTYHRFFSQVRWDTERLWECLVRLLIRIFYPAGIISVDLDDTVFHRTGRKMDGVNVWRDTVRSTVRKIVYCWGLNLVVLTLRVQPPWGGEPLGLPILIRLHRKAEAGLIDLAEAMLRRMAELFPQRAFRACADGFYANLAGRNIPRMHLVNRMRHDAALYDLPRPKKKGNRGRKPKKGPRLSCPSDLAKRVTSWQKVKTCEWGNPRYRLVFAKVVIWYNIRATKEMVVAIEEPAARAERRRSVTLRHFHPHFGKKRGISKDHRSKIVRNDFILGRFQPQCTEPRMRSRIFLHQIPERIMVILPLSAVLFVERMPSVIFF